MRMMDLRGWVQVAVVCCTQRRVSGVVVVGRTRRRTEQKSRLLVKLVGQTE